MGTDIVLDPSEARFLQQPCVVVLEKFHHGFKDRADIGVAVAVSFLNRLFRCLGLGPLLVVMGPTKANRGGLLRSNAAQIAPKNMTFWGNKKKCLEMEKLDPQ
jgi:hypothetical protein